MARKKEQQEEVEQRETIFGGPTKRFFVSMLPRDITLEDAILDLIDNSVDGAMRTQKSRLKQKAPFRDFYASLTLSSDGFEIEDNCGGIPEAYVEDAFSLGRPSLEKDKDLPTIGMYGIGMKRAVFKIGNEALVQSNSKDGLFEVTYTTDWLNPNNDLWDLPIDRYEPDKKAGWGVTITITDVRREIGKRFDNEAFINGLKGQISEHFGYLMQRGFSISMNGEELRPRTLQLAYNKHSKENTIRPFDFEANFKGVDIKVAVGFFRPLVRESEIDHELEGPREADKAGVSVVCNDRVILLCDRTMKTGWGDGGVPRYHPQFRAIAGIVVFSSSAAEKLPISTTKRDLDVGSEVYLKARKVLMEGLKVFTSFTNKWKGMEEETEKFFSGSRADAKTQVSLASQHGTTVRSESGAKKYVPRLPLPPTRDPQRRISFLRNESKIKLVSEYLFEDPAQKPSTVGEQCFDLMFEEANEK